MDRQETDSVATASPTRRTVIMAVLLRLRFPALFALIALAASQWDAIASRISSWRTGGGDASASLSQPLGYFCPMHPSVQRGSPASCPICGMPLSRKDPHGGTHGSELAGRVQLTPWRLALAGITTASVEPAALSYEIQAAGTIEFDTARTTKMVAPLPGRVSALVVSRTGVPVKEGQLLIEVQGTELLSACATLLTAHRASADAVSGGDPATADRTRKEEDRARARARQAGLSDEEVEKVLKTQEPISVRPIPAPTAGVIVKWYVAPGDTVHRGTELADLVRLDSLVARASLHEDDLSIIAEGCPVEGRLDSIPGEVLSGKVEEIASIVKHPSHSVELRLSLENPRLLPLREGMHVSLDFHVPVAATLPFRNLAPSAPKAVDTPAATVRAIHVCPTHGDVVRLAPGKCSVCGAALQERALRPDERLLYWCPMHPETLSPAPGICTKCGTMDLLPKIERALPSGTVLAVPAAAVIDTGRKKVVYLEVAAGLFEPREVVLGPRAGGSFPLLSGLRQGDRIVATGAFLLDAETRLNPSISSTYFGGAAPTHETPDPSGR
jgi:Cu(I)/Ag(I) efflux system membrane fusion protein